MRAGQRVLDVAAGNGNASLAAARRWCEVTSTDYVPQLLERGRLRAAAENFSIDFREADAEALPFADNSFDVVLSTFGVMFTPNQEQAAAELARVCRKGGKIGLANWTPEIHRPDVQNLGQISAAADRRQVARLVGNEGAAGPIVRRKRRLDDITPRAYVFRYRSPEHFVDFFATWYGPMLKAFAALDADSRKGLREYLIALARRFNRTSDDAMIVPREYIEAVIVKRSTKRNDVTRERQ